MNINSQMISRASGATGSRSITLKLIAIGFLMLVLIIPQMMVLSLVGERASRREAAVDEIASMWAPRAAIGGPILVVPYQTKVLKTFYENGQELRRYEAQVRYAYFLADTLAIKAKGEVSERYRGIFKANVFDSDISFSGTFLKPDLDAVEPRPDAVYWGEARVILPIPAPKSVRTPPRLDWGKQHGVPMKLATKLGGIDVIHLAADIDGEKLRAEGETPFKFTLGLKGTDQLTFLPTANDMRVNVEANWPTPSFNGTTIPAEHAIGKKGFSAAWRDSLIHSGLPSAGDHLEPQVFPLGFDNYGFGVKFFDSVDIYHQLERSVKYAMLFLLLTFGAFFLFEVRLGIMVHPFQYLLVGMANCIFYLLLLSLSEHLPFLTAYVGASTAVVVMIGLYSVSVLKATGRSAIITVGLSVLYAFLFVLLVEQEYSLLIGSLALFACLGLVMWVTRNIDWTRPQSLNPGEVK